MCHLVHPRHNILRVLVIQTEPKLLRRIGTEPGAGKKRQAGWLRSQGPGIRRSLLQVGCWPAVQVGERLCASWQISIFPPFLMRYLGPWWPRV